MTQKDKTEGLVLEDNVRHIDQGSVGGCPTEEIEMVDKKSDFVGVQTLQKDLSSNDFRRDEYGGRPPSHFQSGAVCPNPICSSDEIALSELEEFVNKAMKELPPQQYYVSRKGEYEIMSLDGYVKVSI